MGTLRPPLDLRSRNHAAYWAFLLHRLSGLLLGLFLPVHFWALGRALQGEGALESFLEWTRAPWVQASEVAIVLLLAAHLTGGLRLLMIEFHGWRRDWEKTVLALAGGAALFAALAFALGLYRP